MDKPAPGPGSFARFVRRRYELGGGALIENGHPWFVPADALEARAGTGPDGYLSFAHYDYLGLARDPRVIGAAKAALDAHGTGAGASRLVGGERLAHGAFEADLADFTGTGAVLTLISGYLTNLSVIAHVLGARDLVLTDALAHNSIEMGARSGRYTHKTFRHNDLDDLDRMLGALRGDYARVLIAVDGLYSMDGDLTVLPRLVEIKERHDAWLMLDEAHSYGVMGATGRGLCEHFGIDPARIELQIGTLSKTFAASGGFVAATPEVIEWLRFSLPGFVYSVGLSPATVASAQAALDILRAEPERVTRLRRNSAHFLAAAQAAGLNTGDAAGHGVVPILFDNPLQTLAVGKMLEDQGIFAPPIIHVGVPKDLPRIRFFISAAHTEAQIDRAIAAVASAVKATTPARAGRDATGG